MAIKQNPALYVVNLSDIREQEKSTVDLTNCDLEPIHHIGGIQPIGFLVAIAADWIVARISANATEYLNYPAGALLGALFTNIIGREAAHAIRNRLSLLRGVDAVERAFAIQLQDVGPLFDLVIYFVGKDIVIEAEPSHAAGELNAGIMLRSMMTRMQGQASLVHEAARLIQALTGFDRVMIYRFHSDQSGEVIAERARPGLVPYLGLRYPAEDIPHQARALMLRNPLRLLADVDAEPSPILSLIDKPLDLSMSILRAHSLMHIEYLKNMGVSATMTISLVQDGTLWGLISCHHMTPRHVGSEQRTTAELFAQMLSFLIEKRERDDLLAYEAHTRALNAQLIEAVVQRGSAGESIAELAGRMAGLMPCDGVAVYVDGRLKLDGITPTATEFASLTPLLDQIAAGKVYATEQLSPVFPPAAAFIDRAAGLLAIPLSRSSRDHLVFFRREVAQKVIWAGEPGKVVVPGPHGDRLAPRKSFEAWTEIVRGHCEPWTEAEFRAAETLRTTLLEVVLHLTGMTEAESRVASQRQELLIAELNHRVRNILGLIRGLVAQSRTSAVDVDTFATVLGDRVHALARAHNQITARNWGPASLATLVKTEVAAFLGDATLRINTRGPEILLQPAAFSTVALIIHELVTNAVKHGALSNEHGHITIEWNMNSASDLVLIGLKPAVLPLVSRPGAASVPRSFSVRFRTNSVVRRRSIMPQPDCAPTS